MVKREFFVSPIIPNEGLAILAGRPKSMKSFLVLDLAYKIQNRTNSNKRFLSQGEEKSGGVLLLDFVQTAIKWFIKKILLTQSRK